ncbi:MAG: radical SAM protein [Prevotellaceae bacterium]|nr:radical SAM protein [Prevotellaceae bacterium]
MKESAYNYYVPYGDKTIVFNSRKHSVFAVSAANAGSIKAVLANSDAYEGKFQPFLQKMLDNGFLCADAEDERALVMEEYRRHLFPNYYRLMILPTYRCNLSCWYCVQDHRHVDLSEETIRRIKKHIRKYLTEHEISKFHISWFGGEPLLKYDVILDISSYAMEVCRELGITMNSGITTNSLLLTPERIKALGTVGVDFFQITIDGNREEHNKVKCLRGVDTFSKALNNIVDILRLIPRSRVNLRINYSKETLEPLQIVEQVNEIIPSELRDRIDLTPKKIWQEKERSINKEKVNEINFRARQSGYCSSSSEFGICYVDHRHFSTIYPDGSVDICNMETQDGRAKLTAEGDIEWPFVDMCLQQCADKGNIICNTCMHFPLCWGPCPVWRNSMIRQFGKVMCRFSNSIDLEERMNREVISYYEKLALEIN